jgi:Cu/Zn superoxide dismutase
VGSSSSSGGAPRDGLNEAQAASLEDCALEATALHDACTRIEQAFGPGFAGAESCHVAASDWEEGCKQAFAGGAGLCTPDGGDGSGDGSGDGDGSGGGDATPPAIASVNLVGRDGVACGGGNVRLVQTDGGLRLDAQVFGLTDGSHGFHFHELGVCDGDFTSNGKHFIPAGTGEPLPPNLESAGGVATVDNYIITNGYLDGPSSVRGKAMVVHEIAPDNAIRVCCGIVQ